MRRFRKIRFFCSLKILFDPCTNGTIIRDKMVAWRIGAWQAPSGLFVKMSLDKSVANYPIACAHGLVEKFEGCQLCRTN